MHVISHLRGWLARGLLGLLLISASAVHASIPPVSGTTTYSDKGFFTSSGCGSMGQDGFTSADAAAAHLASAAMDCGNQAHASDNPRPTYSLSSYSRSGLTVTYSFTWTYSNGATGGSSSGSGNLTAVTAPGACPANSTPDAGGASCTCASGYVENSTKTACQPAEAGICDLAKNRAFWSTTDGRPALGSSVCMSEGCRGTWQSVVTYTDKVTGKVTSEGSVLYDGTACTPTSTEPTAGQDDCPQGYQATMNGVTVCKTYDPNTNVMESQKKKDSTASSSATPASGAASSPAPAASSASSGTESTKCDGGQCTTTKTETTTNSDGSTSTKTETSTQPQSDFCKDNPTAPQCKPESSFAGSCDAGFSCKGDAVQCAIAHTLYDQACNFSKAPQSDVDKGTEARGKGIPDSFWSTTSLANLIPAPPGSSCPFGVTSVTFGTGITAFTVALDLSPVCPYVAKIKAVVVGFGAVLFALIVLGRKL